MPAAQKAAAKDLPLAKYKVLSRIEHDGETYKLGDTLELTKPAADALIEAGVLEAA